MSLNSPKNQSIKRKLVEREVLCQINSEVEFILTITQDTHVHDAPYSWDDVTNLYLADIDEMKEFINDNLDGQETEELYERFLDEFEDDETIDLEKIEPSDLQDYLQENHDFEPRHKEIYEWWKVSSWFAEKLTQQGECIIEHANIWGRQTSGQAILLDHVISKIAMEMEILDGMKNEWEVD